MIQEMCLHNSMLGKTALPTGSKYNLNRVLEQELIILSEKKGAKKTSRTPMACWISFVYDDMLKDIISCTNKYIETKKTTYKRERNAKNNFRKRDKNSYWSSVFCRCLQVRSSKYL